MRVSFIGHAALLVETRGVSILSDPWWAGACFGAQWWLHPRPWLAPLEEKTPDFIYISHGHHDHLHPGTLSRLDRSAKILVSEALDIAEPLRKMNFEVITLPPATPTEIAPGVMVEITPTHSDDTMMIVSDGTESCVNLNDAAHSAPEPVVADVVVQGLRARYGRPDYVFCGYGTASHFPNCYRVPGKDDAATAVRRQSWFNNRWATIIGAIEPRYAFPFAADVVFLEEDLFWLNEPLHNAERPTDVFHRRFPDSATEVVDIAPGFVIEDGAPVSPVTFEPVSASALRASRAEDIEKANSVKKPSRKAIEEVAEKIAAQIDLCRTYLQEYPGNYRFLVNLRGADAAVEIAKRGNDIAAQVIDRPESDDGFDIVFTTRQSYLRNALGTDYGNEVLFVGSGGIFTYSDAARARENLHNELKVLLQKRAAPPRSRFGDQPRWKFQLKQSVKKMLGRGEADLYDLGRWIVFERP